MTNYVRVTPEQVLAAKILVAVEQKLGRESDPLVVRLANAVKCIPTDNRLEGEVMGVQESDQDVLANLMRRVLTENADWSIRYLYENREDPVDGLKLGLSLETDIGVTVEEYFAVQRVMKPGNEDE